jgi:hypothetical protein
MRRIHVIPALAAVFLAVPALAQNAAPVGDRDPNAVDIAKTPVTDLNIDSKEIPELLIQAQREPYRIKGLGGCRQLIAAVEEFDELLGPDLDLPQEERDRVTASRVGKAVVGSFIPFRGIIREVSGASEHARRTRAAIQAGLARRGFLKGVGQERGCKYPGRPATRKDIDEWLARTGTDQKPEPDKQRQEGQTRFSSQPVVQPID